MASKIRYRIKNRSTYIYKNLALEATTNSKQLFALSYRLSLIHSSHVTYLEHLDTAYQSSKFVCHYLSLSLQRSSNPQTLIVRKRTLNHLSKFDHLTIWSVLLNSWVFELSGSWFESRYSHLNFRYRVCFEQGIPWHSGNYRV